MGLIMGSLGKMKKERLEEVRSDSARFFDGPEMRVWDESASG
jgi:hypothetical protein